MQTTSCYKPIVLVAGPQEKVATLREIFNRFINDFESRVHPHMDTIISHNEDVAIVAHAGVMRAAMMHRCDLSTRPAWELTDNYCCVFDLTRKELVIQ